MAVRARCLCQVSKENISRGWELGQVGLINYVLLMTIYFKTWWARTTTIYYSHALCFHWWFFHQSVFH